MLFNPTLQMEESVTLRMDFSRVELSEDDESFRDELRALLTTTRDRRGHPA